MSTESRISGPIVHRLRMCGCTAAALFVLASSAPAAPFHVRWDASSGLFPEQVGWTRFGNDPTGGVHRELVDGVLRIDTRDLGFAFDLYNMDLSGLTLESGETLEITWRMRTIETREPYGNSDVRLTLLNEADQYVEIISGPDYVSESLFQFGRDEYLAPLVIGEYHTYIIKTVDWQNYNLWVDDRFTFSGELRFQAIVSGPLVGFGDSLIGGSGSLSEWQYVDISVVPEPGAVAVTLMMVILTHCRKDG